MDLTLLSHLFQLSYHMPEVFGFLPIIAGALAGWGIAGGTTALAIGAIGSGAVGAMIGGGIGAAHMSAGNAQAQAARKAANAANDATERQYYYDIEAWEMNKERLKQQHDYTTQSIQTKARNEERLAQYQDQLAQNRYNYDLMIRDHEQQSLDAQFLKSNELYDAQTHLNTRTAQDARQAEIEKFQELQIEAAFQNDELLTETLITQGQVSARGIEGRSAGKIAQTILAQKGRKQAMIAESVMSGARNTRAVLKEIAKDKEAADMAAFATKMLDPGVLPEPLEPIPTPRADFIYPQAPEAYDFGPRPILGAMQSLSAASDLGWATTIGGIANTAGAVLPALIASDAELKENIKKVDISPSGLNIYEWNYIGESTSNRYRGVIAQDLLAKQRHDAVVEMDNGYYGVDYSKVDVPFTRV